jgi:hypothetical protein
MPPTIFDITTRRGRERAREVWTGQQVACLTSAELEGARAAGYEPDGEHLIGRDPRAMSQDELRTMGHRAMSPMEAIRAKCLDCQAGSADEVRKCVAMVCPSWPFRTGKNPWREVSEGRREAGRRLAARMAGKSSEPKLDRAPDAGSSANVPDTGGGPDKVRKRRN